MKYLLIFTTFFCFFCSKPDFEVVDATSQKWIAGVRGGGYGVNYKIEIKTLNSSDKLSIDQLWIGDEYYKMQLVKDAENQFNPVEVKDFKANEKLYIIASKYTKTDRDGDPLPEEKTPETNIKVPKEYEGAALIGFKIKNKRKYKVVKTIRKLENLNHP